VNAGISLVIGFLIERYKRINFVQREGLLAARKRIEQMSSMKSKLISIISHDLKSPLNNLKGLLHLQDTGLMTAQESMIHFAKVGKSVDGLFHLLQNLVHWSKSQLEGFKPEFKNIEVGEIVKDVLFSIESLSAEKNITILNKVDKIIYFFGDREMMKLIIRNILGNSIKFSHPGSTIEITALIDTNRCIVSIHDHGIGMSPQEIQSLFSIKKNPKYCTQK
jgi:signal transduction histidine kinase